MKWGPSEREQNQPKKLDALLDSLLYKLSGSLTQEITIIIDKWDSIVGEKFSKLTHPTHIKNNKLHLQANDAAIAQELEWREGGSRGGSRQQTSPNDGGARDNPLRRR